MKTTLSILFVLCASFAGAVSGLAQSSTTVDAKAVATADEMEQLVAPIALYPDVLVALILPAAIESADVVLAARFVEKGGSETEIEGQPWDQSVKGLARYPDVVKWMDENLSWTQQLGDAYVEKPEEVMAAIQRVRARAKAQGLLVSTAEQQVVAEGEYIRIVPAQPNVVYVPRYDPEVIFVERPVLYRPDPWITFGVGFGVGWWLGYDCDWGRRVIVVNPHYRQHWRHHHDWRHDRFVHNHRFHPDWKPWRPTHRHPGFQHRGHNHFNRPGRQIARPTPHIGAPRHNWNRRDHRDHLQRNRAVRRDHFGRNDGAHREIARPPVSTWRAGPRGQAIQQPAPGVPRVQQPRERQMAQRHEWRRDGDGNRRREQRRELNANPPQVNATPPASTMRQFRPEQGARPQFQRRREMGQRPAIAQRQERMAGAPRMADRTPRATAPRVAAAPTPRVAPAPQSRAHVGSDGGFRSAPRIAAPAAPERSSGSGQSYRGGGGHHGGGNHGGGNRGGGHRGGGRGRADH